ncbi:MAG: hypothetical protein ORO03_06140 [Alphaproteobacteria bacterium]|nr:hypothetical protein [Alphaproteobacteria bacterium]
MSDPNPKTIFEDLMRIASGSSAGILGGARDAMTAAQQEFHSLMLTSFEKLAGEMKLARTEDVETLKAMIGAAREAQEQLSQQFAELNQRLAAVEQTLADKKPAKQG